MQTLLAPTSAEVEEAGPSRRNPHKAAIEAAKAQIQPLVLEHMDVGRRGRNAAPGLRGTVDRLGQGTARRNQNPAQFRRAARTRRVADRRHARPRPARAADRATKPSPTSWSTGPSRFTSSASGKLELTEVVFRDDAHLMNICTKIVTRIGRRIDESRPLVDARLAGRQPRQHHHPAAGDRRRLDLDPQILQEDDHPRHHGRRTATSRRRWRRSLKIAARCRLNILISGGTGSGKTTLLERAVAHDRRRRAHRDDRRRRRIAAAAAARRPPRNPPRQPRRHRRNQHARPGEERAAHAARPHHHRRVPRRGSARHAAGDEHRPRRLDEHDPCQQPARGADPARKHDRHGRHQPAVEGDAHPDRRRRST